MMHVKEKNVLNKKTPDDRIQNNNIIQLGSLT